MPHGRIARVGIVTAVLLLSGLLVSSFAQSPPEKKEPTPEQKALHMEMHAKTEAIKKECMEKMRAVRQEYEPKLKALGMPMPGEGRGPGMQGARPEGPKPGSR